MTLRTFEMCSNTKGSKTATVSMIASMMYNSWILWPILCFSGRHGRKALVHEQLATVELSVSQMHIIVLKCGTETCSLGDTLSFNGSNLQGGHGGNGTVLLVLPPCKA